VSDSVHDSILVGRGIRVCYDGRPVLDVSAIEVRRGETLAIIGPNGAGKSTLLRVLGLLERPQAGTIHLGGHLVNGNSNLLALRRRFASVFQDALLIDATVEKNVALGLELRRMPRAEIDERTRRWMHRLGIAGLASRQARTLSGGEAQRVSLARAFAIEPDILLLDEPFAALDPPTRENLFRDLQRLLRENRITTVFVTHTRREAMRLGERVAVMIQGRCEQIGAPDEVFSRPVCESVARFVGIENLFAGRVSGHQNGLLTIDMQGVSIRAHGQLPAGASVWICLRPEDLSLQPAFAAESPGDAAGVPGKPHAGSPEWNSLAGRILDVLPTGMHYRVEIDCGPRLMALIGKHAMQESHLANSAAVRVSFQPSAAHLIVRS
jgi:tungstate transport system ATP-binding protein